MNVGTNMSICVKSLQLIQVHVFQQELKFREQNNTFLTEMYQENKEILLSIENTYTQ